MQIKNVKGKYTKEKRGNIIMKSKGINDRSILWEAPLLVNLNLDKKRPFL